MRQFNVQWAVALLAACCGSAMADVYVEGAVGRTYMRADCTNVSVCDTHGHGRRAVLGYSPVDPAMSFEVGLLHFGTAHFQTEGGDSSRATSKAWDLAVSWRADLEEHVSGTLRVGMAHVTTRWDLGGGDSASASHNNLLAGVGLEWRVATGWRLLVAMDQTKSADPMGVGKGALRLFSAGVRYDF